MNKVIFLDRDGTINKDDGFTHKVGDAELIPNTIKGLQSMKDQGYRLIIVTNQSGIGRGHYTEAQMHKFNNYLINKLKQENINIEAVLFCPHTPQDNCSCRKPKPGMILEAISTNNLKYDECIMIGDSIKDIEAANSAGIDAFLLDTNFNSRITFNNKIQSLISLI